MKCDLLSEGLFIPENILEKLTKLQKDFNLGRKGGAGPAGGRYLRFSTGEIINTPLWIIQPQQNGDKNPISRSVIEIRSDSQLKTIKLEIINSNDPNEPTIILELLSIPKFHNQNNNEGIPFSKIALMHGDKTLATTINQRCKYWESGTQCKFCGIEYSLNAGATTELKTGREIIEVIAAAKQNNPIFASHLTLTSGTPPSPDHGMEDYINIAKSLKETYPKIPIHIQIEPMKDLSWYDKAREAGVDTIGIHLEILNNEIRRKICPGKSILSKETYYKHWRYAIDVFGQNQVSTFILTGFDTDAEHLEQFKKDLEEVIKIGTVPLITPARMIKGQHISIPMTPSKQFQEINLFAAEKCIQYGVYPLKNKAGCIRCGGCSPILEAYRLKQLNRR
ncbi:MAG: radical SAM protein [Promethearchaeota archaeon]